MDLKRRFSTGDIDPKVSRTAIARSELSPKLTRFENCLSTTKMSEPNRGRKMSSTENVVNLVVSPLKRKSSSQIEMTSLHSDAKRRRHHRRKPNKKWRHKSVTAEKSKSVGQNTASSTTTAAIAKCQKDGKLNGSANSNNSASQLLWKKKRKQQFFHHNSGAAVAGTTSGPGQHSHAVQSHRLPGHGGGGAGRKRTNDVVLRPTKVPLLNAPRNSTQFIIDDHESSDLVWNFETRTTVPRHQQQPKEISASVESDAVDDSSSSSPPAFRRRISSDCENLFTSSRSVGNDDEDTFWHEFSERDFQSVYETAHQEEIAEWDRKKLVEEIASLERRHKELVKVLARLDPQVYVSRLQRELGKLQEQNRILKSSTTTTTKEPEMEINEVDPAVEKTDENDDDVVEEPDSIEKCKSSSQDETLPDSTND